METHLAEIEHELSYIMDDLKIHPDVQAKISAEGYSELRMFSKADEGNGDKGIRTFIKDVLGIDASTATAARTATARIVLAWEAVLKRVNTRVEAEALQRSGDGPKTVPKADYGNVVKALNDRRGVQPEYLQSSQAYHESRLEQMEDGIYVAETWSEVTTIEEDKTVGTGTLQFSRDGKCKMVRGVSYAPVPTTSEELRSRFKVMAHHWEMIRLKFPKKLLVRDVDFSSTWLTHVEWLLGEEVARSTVAEKSTGTSHTLPWEQLIELDYQVRKLAMHKVTHKDISLVDALQQARIDQATLQKFLWIPLGIYAAANASRGMKRPAPVLALGDQPPQIPPQRALMDRQGGGKKNGKPQQQGGGASNSWGSGKNGGGKGNGKKGDDGAADEKDGGWKAGASMYTTGKPRRRKCIPYQKGKCQKADCTFAHVCFVCGEKHGQYKCDRKPKQAS